MKIAVENLNKNYTVDIKAVRRIAGRVLGCLAKKDLFELGIIFLDDVAIRRINRRFKKEDRATDVLSFDLDEGLREIYISIDRAAANSRRYRTGPAPELVRYIIHGILHLYGYDDLKREERTRMSAKEDEILRWLATKENLSKVLTPR